MISTKKISDTIPMLTANDQYFNGKYVYIGIDTEMLFTVNKKKMWPHQEGFSQERPPQGLDFDWHGDGYAFELCTAPFICLEWLSGSIGRGLKFIHDQFGAKAKAVGLYAPPVYKVPVRVQESATDDIKRLGCAPSLNVYGDSGRPNKLGASVRTTGCHLHATHPTLNDENTALAFVQWADVIVGNVWNYVSPERPNLESMRRAAYGRAGEFRARTYPATRNTYACKGVEYRVLPGSVIKNPVYLSLCFNLYRTALRFAVNHGAPDNEVIDLSRQAINTADKEVSAEVIKWLPFPEPAAKLLHILRAKPLPTLNPLEWYNSSQNHNLAGHRFMAIKEGLASNEG